MTVKTLHYLIMQYLLAHPDHEDQEVVARVRHPECSAGTRVHLEIEETYPYKNALVLECSDPE